jgi:ribonuclease T1
MQKNYTQLLLGLIVGLLVGLVLGRFVFTPKQNIAVANNNSAAAPQQNNNHNNEQGGRRGNSSRNANSSNDNNYSGTEEVPAKVLEVLQYVKANGKAMDGYVGGRVFENRENQLPMNDNNGNKIKYQEWDVNQKVNGQNRGTQRIVTGSDNRSWYTSDHYKTFTLIKQ